MASDGPAEVVRTAIQRAFAEGAARRTGGLVLPGVHLNPPPTHLPALASAIQHYDALADPDGAFALDIVRHLGTIDTPAGPVYLLLHGWELGTDGWMEVFDSAGEPLGAGQYIGDRVDWATVEEVRHSIATGRRVPALRFELDWVEGPKGVWKTRCGQFRLAAVKKGWRLTRQGEFIQTWDTFEQGRAHAAALALPPQ